jgi:hypothetical protein
MRPHSPLNLALKLFDTSQRTLQTLLQPLGQSLEDFRRFLSPGQPKFRFSKLNVGHTAPLHSLKFFHFQTVSPFLGRRLAQCVITVSLPRHVVRFCCCFHQFEAKFNKNSLLLYRLHIKTANTQSQILLQIPKETLELLGTSCCVCIRRHCDRQRSTQIAVTF